MPMRGHPPEPVDFGAMTDNCGNCVVWMRPAVLDDIINETLLGNESLGLEVRKRFEVEAAQIRARASGLPTDIEGDLSET